MLKSLIMHSLSNKRLDTSGIFSRILSSIGLISVLLGLHYIWGGSNKYNLFLVFICFLGLIIILAFPQITNIRQFINRFNRPTVSSAEKRAILYDLQSPQISAIEEKINQFRKYISNEYGIENYYLYLKMADSATFTTVIDGSGIGNSDIIFPEQSSFVQTLIARKKPLNLESAETLPRSIQLDRTRLNVLGVNWVIPIFGEKNLQGWLAIGSSIPSQLVTRQTIQQIDNLCHLFGLEIEQLNLIIEYERQIHEMDILTRISQGINITIHFDDILELIYAQTSQIIDCSNFWISLVHPEKEGNQFVFFVEENERIREMENKHIPQNMGLELIVQQSRKAFLAENYDLACQMNSVLPVVQNLISFISVPLMSGDEIIGTISIGSRKPDYFYSSRSQQLLQAIADQAAAAIIKTRLLEKTQRQAHRLTSLNEIGQLLTSTLELQTIIDLTIENIDKLLACDSSMLFLVDYDTGEIRLAGINTKNQSKIILSEDFNNNFKKLIQNKSIDVMTTKINWSGNEIRFQPELNSSNNNALVVPLSIENKVVGLIVLVDKTDQNEFSQDDIDLIITFGNQVAIALDNAKRYTETDEALHQKLTEMSVMQQIDQEMNASLDLTRALKITLSWSIKQTKAEAGLIGRVVNGEFTLSAVEGYNGHQVDQSKVKIPQQTYDGRIFWSKSSFLLPNGGSHVIIPIFRENQLFAIIILESTLANNFNEDNIVFLSRLSDHAAIAISNAVLYSEVQLANTAKSDFVSLVSHELKTPMTAIKGYTDLIAQGTVGQINEVQANFLNTIRSNVNRMATLVSDLTDVSRIESGRLHLEFQGIGLNEILEEVKLSVESQLLDKEQILEVIIENNLPQLWCDRNRVIQICVNLVSNAIKYSPTNSKITFSAKQDSILNENSGSTDVILFSIVDQGYGISMTDQEKIFQKFFRSEDAHIRENPGTGLGLSITKYLVEMQGGKIWFESEQEQGTKFFVTIPITTTD